MIDLVLVKAHLRLEEDEVNEAYLQLLIDAAIRNCEVYLNRPLFEDESAMAEAANQTGALLLTADIKAAMLLTLGYLYEHREDVVVGANVLVLPQNSRWLLDPYRRIPGV